jgi:hypothetical protein
MSILASPRFLPRVIAADAISCAGAGALQLGLTETLARLTGLPAALLTGTGVFLLAYAALAAWMARRPVPPRRLIGFVVAGNLAWAAGCGRRGAVGKRLGRADRPRRGLGVRAGRGRDRAGGTAVDGAACNAPRARPHGGGLNRSDGASVEGGSASPAEGGGPFHGHPSDSE